MTKIKTQVEENFDFNELKNQINQIKEAKKQAEKDNQGKENKQSFGKKIIGILVLIGLIVIVGLVIWFNLDVILLPKNSITVVVTDQNGNAIEELKLNLYADTQSYDIEYSDISDYTILSAVPGDYTVIFQNIPEGYSCSETIDNFTLNQDGKVKLEYECTKEN